MERAVSCNYSEVFDWKSLSDLRKRKNLVMEGGNLLRKFKVREYVIVIKIFKVLGNCY